MFHIQRVPGSESEKYAKDHYASNKAIAQAVVEDLSARFCEEEIVEEPNRKIFWDPGGMLMMNDEVFTFDLGDMSIACYAQHFEYFMEYIKECSKVRGTNVKYHKIHAPFFCLCITPEEFSKLQSLMNSDEYAKKAKASFEERERRIQSLVDGGHVVRAMKDAAGNIIDIDQLAKKCNKDLN